MFYIVFDFMMAVIMFLFGMWFYKSEGKAANFLSGYNMKSADERKKYDENAMCKAYGKRMMFMSVPFIIGIIIVIQSRVVTDNNVLSRSICSLNIVLILLASIVSIWGLVCFILRHEILSGWTNTH